MIQVQLVHPQAKVPKRGDSGAAGLDLYSVGDGFLSPQNRLLVPTGIKVAIPEDSYGRIAPRSGLASNFGIDVLAGVIDSSYRGEVQVLLYNSSEKVFRVNTGDRIAQLIITKIDNSEPVKVESLDSTSRGTQGFGSTGN